MILLIGLAVGVDYSMFYLRREREERARGLSPEAALETAAATSGRAVLVSGLTVIIAMSGMFLMGSSTFSSFAVGTMLVVGDLDRRLAHRPARGALQARRQGRQGPRAAPVPSALSRRPVALLGRDRRRGATRGRFCSAACAVAVLVALAIPAFSLHTVNSGVRGYRATCR